MSIFPDFGGNPSGGGRPPHKPKGKNDPKSDQWRKSGHGVHHYRDSTGRGDVKGRSNDKKASKMVKDQPMF